MDVKSFLSIIGCDFYTGVPDSALKPLCDYLAMEYGKEKHIIAANEGNCVALAAGYHLATEKIPMVYMQNSGEGNIINPLASLLNPKVYAIPMVFVIGWRGEPGKKDEPQHIYQGEVTEKLLEDMGVEHFVVGEETTEEELTAVMKRFNELLDRGMDVAFVVRKGALTYDKKASYRNEYTLVREDAVRVIAEETEGLPVVSTTGKISRELFEIREAAGQGHQYDFLTVGSMGHCSSIALGIALQKPATNVVCIDGDGAVLMHMGSMSVIGNLAPANLIHIVLNNEAHETVGGMPTAASSTSFPDVAKACGYKRAVCVSDEDALREEIKKDMSEKGPVLIEVKCALGARADLGRPTTTALENKEAFMSWLNGS